MNIEMLRRTWAEAGTLGLGIDVAHGAINRCTPCFVLDAFLLRRSGCAPPAPPGGDFREAVLGEDELIRHARNDAADLNEQFVRMACGRGDRCHALLHGEALASYAWCSSRPTHIAPGLVIRFDERWTYTYKAFTLPAYRGRRLHARVTWNLLTEAVDRGAEGVFGCVEVNSFASAKSFRRMGAVRTGILAAVRVHRRYRTHHTAAALAHGFRLMPCGGCAEGCAPANPARHVGLTSSM